ncbi:MAG: hypothetical protein JWN56_1509 [Sphingobacteriales bacterium]|nr:hypothetical protein [Sphingobacteriales bacterium]
MNKNTFLVLLPLLLVHFSFRVIAQTSDTTIRKSADNRIGTVYPNSFESTYPLYNGTQYLPYPFMINDGIRSFITTEFVPATITYDGKTYVNVKSLYDLVDGNLIIQHFDNFFFIRLHPERVESFTISGHTFIRINADSVNTTPAAGFYDLLYDGKVKFLAKRSKTLEEKAVASGLERQINESTKYYLRKDNVYYLINGKSDLLKLLKPHDKLSATFIKSQKLKFGKKHKEASILSTVRYYDQAAK